MPAITVLNNLAHITLVFKVYKSEPSSEPCFVSCDIDLVYFCEGTDKLCQFFDGTIIWHVLKKYSSFKQGFSCPWPLLVFLKVWLRSNHQVLDCSIVKLSDTLLGCLG